MTFSLFAAQFISLLYLSVSLGMLVNPKFYKKLLINLYEEMTALYIGGLISFLIGFALVIYHNLWVGDWRLMITLIGWLAFLKGLSILIFPQTLISIKGLILKVNILAISIAVILLGLIFGYFGFFAG